MLSPHVTFYKTLMSLSTVFIKRPRRISTTFKVAVSHLVFTHVEPWEMDIRGMELGMVSFTRCLSKYTKYILVVMYYIISWYEK